MGRKLLIEGSLFLQYFLSSIPIQLIGAELKKKTFVHAYFCLTHCYRISISNIDSTGGMEFCYEARADVRKRPLRALLL